MSHAFFSANWWAITCTFRQGIACLPARKGLGGVVPLPEGGFNPLFCQKLGQEMRKKRPAGATADSGATARIRPKRGFAPLPAGLLYACKASRR